MRLADLIQPLDIEAFFAEYWESQPLLVRAPDADRYRGLFSLADVDHVLTTPALIHSSTVRVIRDGRASNADQIALRGVRGDHATVEAVLTEHREGATIALEALDRVFAPLRALCQALAADLSATMQANAYLTPPSSQGFDTHFDTHDVFILQVTGAKRWSVFESPVPLPPRKLAANEDAASGSATPTLDAELHPGDLLYIPRGYPHHAVSTGSTSLHLTVGIHTIIWASVLRAALDAQVERDVRFRASLPPRFADDDVAREAATARFAELLRALADTADSAPVLQNAADLVQRYQRPVSAGRLLDIEAADRVNSSTRVRRRGDVDCSIHREGDRIHLSFNGKAITLPAFAADEVGHLMSTQECCADELPGDIDGEGRLVLIRSLLREGLLTICR